MKLIKNIMIAIVSLAILLAGATVLVLQLPQFGKAPGKEALKRISQSPQHNGEAFENAGGVQMSMGLRKMPELMSAYWNAPSGKSPESMEVQHPNPKLIGSAPDSVTALTWYGHSAFILEMDGKVLLLDPMFGPAAAPFSFQVKRFTQELPIEIEQLPSIDAVIFSHDHYDHLDYPTIQKIKDKVGHFYVPLGLGSHLTYWGVDKERITELDWWDQTTFDGIEIVCTPSQHFSGRGLSDRGKTLWSSWVLKGKHHKIFFSGDSGYFNGFKEIGEQHGPFDIALMECGQYNMLWHEIHMLPEETAQAAQDVGARNMMPIHWGMFDLGLHPWTEPVERVSKKAAELNIPLVTPQVGQRFTLSSVPINNNWWTTP